ncbi:MAG: hypothetical protein GMKNLPBB_02470 [Myxococcota bacterium]|nr:hypothetical protein [Myxococcota bacterium]
MNKLHEALRALDDFSSAQRARGRLGRLIGATLPQRDALLAEELAAVMETAERAGEIARKFGAPIEIDGSGASLTDGGDIWQIHPGGFIDRGYKTYPHFARLAARLHQNIPGFDGPAPLDALLLAGFHALWSPSATNWQPGRMVIAGGGLLTSIEQALGEECPDNGTAVLLLRRDHYESLLGDVLGPFGIAVTALEEFVDDGIYCQAVRSSLMAQGIASAERPLKPDQVAAISAALRVELPRRLTLVEAEPGAAAKRERDKLAELHSMVQAGKAIPSAVLWCGKVNGLPSESAFDDLVRARVTQRVASPRGSLDGKRTLQFISEALQLLGPDGRYIRVAAYRKDDPEPGRIGESMFHALYGAGADPQSGQGGDGGFLTRINVSSLAETARARGVPLKLQNGTEEWAKINPMPAPLIGKYIRERLIRDGVYSAAADGTLVNSRTGKPLTAAHFTRQARSLATTFGTFFLKFQNTHPLSLVVLRRTGLVSAMAARAAGKFAFVLSFLARAQGYAGIVKSGPVDLAGEAITSILAHGMTTRGDHGMAQALLSGEITPALTFQMGMPLAPGDLVDEGTPQQHDGVEERRRDKRPPREDSILHIFPALD